MSGGDWRTSKARTRKAETMASVAETDNEWIERPQSGNLLTAWEYLRTFGLGVNGSDRQHVRDLAALLDAAETRGREAALREVAAWLRADSDDLHGYDPSFYAITSTEGDSMARWITAPGWAFAKKGDGDDGVD